MSASNTALLVIDAEESFRHRTYWNEYGVPLFLDRLQALIEGAKAREIPVVQIFHIEEEGVFAVVNHTCQCPIEGFPETRFWWPHTPYRLDQWHGFSRQLFTV